MNINFTQLLAGAIVGQLAGLAVLALRRHFSRRRERRNAQVLAVMRSTKQNSKWLVDYYAATGESESLYDCSISGFEVKVPFITKREWCFEHQQDLRDGGRSCFDVLAGEATGPIDHVAISRRREIGQRIWPDSPSVFIDRIEWPLQGGAPRFVLKPCSYYQAFSNICRLEDETFQGVSSRSFRRASFRAQALPNATEASRFPVKPFGLGGAVCLVLRNRNTCRVLIHERSNSIATYPCAKGVVPNFGFEPLVEHGQASGEDILRYNLLKEYAEELFDYEELVTAAVGKKINPLWFYEVSPQVRHLRHAINSGLCTLTFTGFGFDCLNGVPVVSFLAVIESNDVINDISSHAELNWEGRGIQMVDLSREAHLLRGWLSSGEFHPGAAFAIARALDVLQRRGLIQMGA